MALRLSAKLMLILAAIVISCQLLMSSYYVWSTSAQLLAQHRQHLNSLKVTMARAIAIDVWNYNPESLQLLLAPYQNDPAIRQIFVQANSGPKLLLDATPMQPQSWLLRSFLSNTGPYTEAISLTLGQQSNEVGTLMLQENQSYIEQLLLDALARQFLELLILLSLLAGGLYVAFNRIVLQPLKKLSVSLSAAISDRTGIVANPLTGLQDEFEEVALSIVGLSARLAGDIQTIRDTNASLQHAKEQTEQAMRELRQAQDALLQSEKQASLAALVAGVAHEVNTPLGIIITSVTCLESELQQLHQHMQHGTLTKSGFQQQLQQLLQATELVHNNAGKAAHLISNFKLLAKEQTDESVRWFNLSEFVNELLIAYQLDQQYVGLQWQTAVQPDIHIKAVPGLFHQLLSGLCSNVRLHAYAEGTEGQIIIRLWQDDTHIHLSCMDFGAGIAFDAQKQVFDPFYTTRMGQGSNGLGLSIVHRIVRSNLQGQIELFSAPQQGASFVIHIPRQKPD